ncbi:MAG: pyridoxamine kinase [Clostridia bacterium]|nr:pyridoxamine kinase [Clostridia bacterium]
MQKRALAVHDISCVGKCSLTVALPIISAAGIETSVLPTAVLSTHTGGFTGYTYRDLTSDVKPIIEHWKSLGLKVDAIYTGYLGSFEQLRLVEELFDTFKNEDTLILVDPVMADNGKFYTSFTPEFAKGMAKLCGKADIIVPNLTEAAFMLGEEYVGAGYDRAYIEGLLLRLSALGPKKVVLSGVSYEKGKLGAAAYDAETEKYCYCFEDEVEGYFHGTGDVFGSALLAALMNGKTLDEAIKITVSFTVAAIKRTKAAGSDVRYGVDFENCLGDLIKAVKA